MPNFLFFCHRFFELRFIVSTGILDELSSHGKVTLLLPPNLVNSFKPILEENKEIEIVAAQYTDGIGKFRVRWLNFWGDLLYLTFPNTEIRPNLTAEFHRQHFRSASAIKELVVVILSRAASRYKWFLRFCVACYQFALPTRIHESFIKDLQPDLMIGCTFGLSIEDASFLKEGKHNGVKTVVIVQSWDRTSNKGYPTIHPDCALVWNEIMEEECCVNLGFERDKVHVTGSPLWDTHFRTLERPTDSQWRENLGIEKDVKVLFFACGGFGNHHANMRVIPQVFDLALQQPFGDKIHIVFRLYPQYLSPVTQSGEGKKKWQELQVLLEKYQTEKSISILYPDVDFDGKNFVPNRNDHSFLTECLYQCDLSLSQVSSQMIEACIFDKPAINLEYGRRQTEKYDLELADYKTEHLERIYRTGAIYRIQSPEMLKKIVGEALCQPKEKLLQRRRLIEQEAPFNRGNAAISTARLLLQISQD